MTEEFHWHKAVVISLFLHMLMLPLIGCLTVNQHTMHEVQERWVELELVSDLSGGGDEGTAETVVPAAAVHNESMSMFAVTAAVGNQTSSVRAVSVSMPVQAAEPGDNITTVASGLSGSAGQGTGLGTGDGTGPGTGSGSGTGTGSGAGSGTGNKESGDNIIPPGILSQVEPDYPEQARQAGQAGTVVPKIQILENGRPGQVSVYHSSGFGLLDAAAADAVRQWRFIPAKERGSGQAVACYTTRPVVFRLRS